MSLNDFIKSCRPKNIVESDSSNTSEKEIESNQKGIWLYLEESEFTDNEVKQEFELSSWTSFTPKKTFVSPKQKWKQHG